MRSIQNNTRHVLQVDSFEFPLWILNRYVGSFAFIHKPHGKDILLPKKMFYDLHVKGPGLLSTNTIFDETIDEVIKRKFNLCCQYFFKKTKIKEQNRRKFNRYIYQRLKIIIFFLFII